MSINIFWSSTVFHSHGKFSLFSICNGKYSYNIICKNCQLFKFGWKLFHLVQCARSSKGVESIIPWKLHKLLKGFHFSQITDVSWEDICLRYLHVNESICRQKFSFFVKLRKKCSHVCIKWQQYQNETYCLIWFNSITRCGLVPNWNG